MSVITIKKANGEEMKVIDGAYVIGAGGACQEEFNPCELMNRKVLDGAYVLDECGDNTHFIIVKNLIIKIGDETIDVFKDRRDLIVENNGFYFEGDSFVTDSKNLGQTGFTIESNSSFTLEGVDYYFADNIASDCDTGYGAIWIITGINGEDHIHSEEWSKKTGWTHYSHTNNEVNSYFFGYECDFK